MLIPKKLMSKYETAVQNRHMRHGKDRGTFLGKWNLSFSCNTQDTPSHTKSDAGFPFWHHDCLWVPVPLLVTQISIWPWPHSLGRRLVCSFLEICRYSTDFIFSHPLPLKNNPHSPISKMWKDNHSPEKAWSSRSQPWVSWREWGFRQHTCTLPRLSRSQS